MSLGKFRFVPAELDEALEAYESLGFCVFTGILAEADCAQLKQILADTQARADRGAGEARWFDDATAWEGRLVRKVPKPFQEDSRFREIFSRHAILDLVQAFVGPAIYLHSSKMIYKPPHVGRAKPLHQDLAYWDELSARQVTLWCPVDPATAANGCLELLPGGHRRGLIPHVMLDDWQIAPDAVAGPVAIVEMDAGDMLFLHPLTPHASRANRSGEGRLAAVINFYSEPVAAGAGHGYGSATPIRAAIG